MSITEDNFLKMIKISIKIFIFLKFLVRLDCNQNRFGKVYQYLDGDTMIPRACIKLKKAIFGEQKLKTVWNGRFFRNLHFQIVDELATLVKIEHPRLSQFYGNFANGKKFLIFREFTERGSILDKILRGPLGEDIALKYLRQACEGLKFLHGLKICHGNVRG